MPTKMLANVPLNTFTKFHQFSKLEDSKDDGMPTVWGIATWEKPDSDNEVCDYETAVPVYQSWSAKAFKRTSNAGQAPSLGNIRLQHSSDVGGKATKIEYDDSDKEIWLGSEPISDTIKDQLKQGFYTGYSQGGSYAWRACNKCETPLPMQQGNNYCANCDAQVVVRYGLKRLAEVSYVDSPATGEGFEHVKANGSTEILKFQQKENSVEKDKKTKRVAGVDLPAHCFAYVGDPEKTETWKLPINFPGDDEKTKRHIRNALARFGQTQGIPEGEKAKVKAKIEAAARSHGIDVDGSKSAITDGLRKFIEASATKAGLAEDFTKSLYEVSRFADILESLAQLWSMCVWEKEIEGDDSDMPNELKTLLDDMVEAFLAMATEEAKELSARKTETGEKTMTPEELKAALAEFDKAAKKSLASHFAKKSAHHEKMEDHHEAIAEGHTAKGELHEKMHKALECKCGKADVGADHPHAGIHEVLEDQQAIHKAFAAEEHGHAADHMKCAKAHGKMAAHYGKMAESHDEETAKTVKAECAAEAKVEEDAIAKAIVTPPVVSPVGSSLDEDVKKAAEARRGSQEYKDAIAAIAKAQVEAEVAALSQKTLAPLGVTIDKETGAAILKAGLSLVPRDVKPEPEMKLAAAASPGSFGGL